jgi:ribonuclease Z
MIFSLTTLGTASALPTVDRFPSAHVLNVHERLFLIDCGEGCQMQLRRYGISFLKINEIFISHVHGDHVFGIYGLLSTMSLLGRSADLFIYAPSDFGPILKSLTEQFGSQFKYNIVHVPVSGKEPKLIFETKSSEVLSFPLNHRTGCYGYLFREKQPRRNIHKYLIEKHSLSLSEIARLKDGDDIERPDGEILRSDIMTYLPYRPRSFAYCSDTAPFPKLREFVSGVDLLYHEATFLQETEKVAALTLHSTARQAALLAMEAGAGKLVIGHFSSRYKNSAMYENEAREVFPETYAAREGAVFEIPLSGHGS